MNGILLFVDELLKLIELHLPFTQNPAIADEEMTAEEREERENSQIIVQHLFIVLYYFTKVDTTVEDYVELFITVSLYYIALISSSLTSPALSEWLFPRFFHSILLSACISSLT